MNYIRYAVSLPLGIALSAFSLCSGAQPADYPTRAIQMVVPYPPGSGSDVVARLLTQRMADTFKQPVTVDNRSGASTNIGTELVARAAADGYTLLFQAPNLATNVSMFSNIKWGLQDFTGVVHIANYANVLVAGPGGKYADFRELLAQSKVESGAFSYGSPGVGSVSHLAVELLKQRSGLKLEHVSYKGPSQMAVDLAGGHLAYAASNISNVFSAMKDSKSAIRPVVLLSQKRSPALPDTPSLADIGITGLEGSGWYGVAAPAKTPAPVVARLNAEINRILRLPEIAERFRAMHIEAAGGSPDEFTRFLAAEAKKWGDIIRTSNIKAD